MLEENKMSAKYYCLCLFSVFFLFSSALLGDTNILINPGFETGTFGWTGRSCSIAPVNSPPPYDGSYCAMAYGRTDTWQGIQQDVRDAMVDGETYMVSGWVRISADSGTVKISVQKTDGSNNGYPTYVNVATGTANNTGWISLSNSYTLDVNGTLSELLVYVEGPNAGVDIYVDDVNVFGPEPGPPAPVEPNATGEIDPTIRYQVLEGFGAANVWSGMTLYYNPEKDEIYDVIFRQLGLDILRLRNTYESDSGYIDRCADAVAGAEASLGHPIKVLISSWSPPARLKSNGSTVNGGTLTKYPDGQFMYDEYAQWWADSIADYADRGIVADYIGMQNEPNWAASWDTCLFNPTEGPNVAGYDIAFETLWQKLNTEMGPAMPKMLAAEVRNMTLSGDYLDNLIDANHAYGWAHHLYGDGGSATNPDGYIPRMMNFSGQYNDKPLFQTEYSDDSHVNSFEACMDLALLMHNSLVIEGVSSYMYWQLVYSMEPRQGLVSVDWSSYAINPIYYAFKHYSAFTDPNWQRVEASTDNPSLRISAFISPDENNLTCVLINTADETDIETNLSFVDFYVEDGNVYRTSRIMECAFIGYYDRTEPLMLPAESITTLALTISDNFPPVADAGPDQSVYAFVDGWADVNMDGSGSYDQNGDTLSYHWSWSINGSDYEATGVSPTISLPAGAHTIELVVDDGAKESQTDDCTVNVTPPIEARLLFVPKAIKEKNCYWHSLLGIISLPSGIDQNDVDKNVSPFMYPSGKECWFKSVFMMSRQAEPRTHILTFFSKAACKKELEQGMNEIIVGGRLNSGQYYSATGYLWLVETKRDLPQPFRLWKQMYRRWFKWKTDDF
jgi:glucuronoarabinoxylan endo-1,4-beta-xylanase